MVEHKDINQASMYKIGQVDQYYNRYGMQQSQQVGQMQGIQSVLNILDQQGGVPSHPYSTQQRSIGYGQQQQYAQKTPYGVPSRTVQQSYVAQQYQMQKVGQQRVQQNSFFN
jgi:hypothetical protein